MTKIERVLQHLKETVELDEYLDICEEAAEELRRLPNAFDSVEPILRLMEEHDDIEFGSPGPLVHFVETFYQKGYEEKLIESLKRRPTTHTLWMLNRIINGAKKAADRKRYSKVLSDVLTRPDLSDEVREAAERGGS